MRTLTNTQKKLLDSAILDGKKNNKPVLDHFSLSSELCKQLESINDTEILYQEINRYLWDKADISYTREL